MRILWLGKEPVDGAAGDEVFDRKTIAALRAEGHSVTTLHPKRVASWREIANLVRGVPHYRSRYASGSNRRLVRASSGSYDLAICSWEPLDILASQLREPVILVAHNITSRALPALFPGSQVAKFAAWRARRWEGRLYRRATFRAIAALTRSEGDYLAALSEAPRIVLTTPGMPPSIPLEPGAPLRKELVLSGTYDWAPKRRDLLAFVHEYPRQPHRFPILADTPLPTAALLHVGAAPDDLGCRQAIRFGLITDRFQAGFKLKALAYIARNQIVLSFADVRGDFACISDYKLFIRKLDEPSDIARHIDDLAAMPADELRRRFNDFKRLCIEQFDWRSVARTLVAEAS